MPIVFDKAMPAIEGYSEFFGHCGAERFRMEASPSYIYGGKRIAETIRKELGAVKVLIILRDPVDRLISFFSRAVSKSVLSDDISFSDYISQSASAVNDNEHNVYSRGIREGMYFRYIDSWQNVFGDELRILFFEDLKANTFEFTVNTCEWLGLDANCYSPKDFTIENKTVHYRHRKLHEHIKDLYMKNEAFWRKHNKIKRHLRTFYNIFNAGTTQKLPTIDDDAVLKLRAIYEPYNRELRSFLKAHNYLSLPHWLS